MALIPFICVFLMSCYSSKTPFTPQEFPNCPDYCQCYSAPKGGDGADTSVSLVCDWKVKTPFNHDKFKTLSNINSLVIENIDDMENLPENMLSSLSINNLVLRKCTLFNIDNNHATFSGLNIKSLKVLTFIDSKFTGYKITPTGIKAGTMSWETFRDMNQIKAIHFSGGELLTIGYIFQTIPVQNIISLTIEETGLKTVQPYAFEKFTKLKMLKIIKNSIETIDWILKIEGPLWYLDLRHNQIKSFPFEVAQKLNKLQTLKLGGNNLHVISYQTAKIFINQLREFSFEQIRDYPLKKKEYFYPTEEMIWINELFDESSKKFQKCPRFLYESTHNTRCIQWTIKDTTVCSKLPVSKFNYPASAISDQVTTAHLDDRHYYFSYLNQMIMLSGAVLPSKWRAVDLEHWFNKITSKGNVIRLHLNMEEWFSISMTTSASINFEKMIQDLEKHLKMAEEKNIFVIINLWKGTLPKEFLREKILPIYLTEHFTPLVKRLSKFKSLLAWDLFELPENLIINNHKKPNEPCLNTFNIQRPIGGVGHFNIDKIQQFLAKQAQIIHKTEHRKLVTLTISETNAFNKNHQGFNHWQNGCLSEAMSGDCPNNDCTLDFYTVLITTNGQQIGQFTPQDLSTTSPKPIVIIVDQSVYNIENIITNWEHWKWDIQGLLITYSGGLTDVINDEITLAISKHMNVEKKFILGPRNGNDDL